MKKIELNKIAEVLEEQGRSMEWLSRKMQVHRVTVSNWCRNIYQPNLYQLALIADLLGVEMLSLLHNPTPAQLAQIRELHFRSKETDGRGKEKQKTK